MKRAREGLLPFLDTPLAHVEVVRADTALDLTRFAIVERDIASARKWLVRLRRERAPYLRAWTLLLEAAADQLEGRTDDARKHLADATLLCEAAGMQVISALARRRTGELMGGDLGARIITDADAVLHRHGVVNPVKFARTFATWPT